jgi:ABC-2 type transport system ATP-binding protein
MIEAKRLCRRFGGELAVDDVSFTVERGEIVGFLGPNGAGKSTTMRMLAGALLPTSGTALVCGQDVRDRRREAQTSVGYLPEAADAFPELTVSEFLTFCGESRGLRGRGLRERIDAVCESLDLRPALAKRLRHLSKGWRQRAWFAQSILHDPSVLIMDEPTDGLDPNQKKHVREFILAVGGSKAVLLSTHVLEEAEEICTRAIIIADGRIVADDSPAALGDERGRLAETFHRLTMGTGARLEEPR